MRHARCYREEKQFLTYEGITELKASVDRLMDEIKEKFPDKKVRIIHSILPRAAHTAYLVCEMLTEIESYLKGDALLNSDKYNINQEYVKELVVPCDERNEICIILSHQPDINDFAFVELKNSQYLAKTIEINEQPISPEEITDDLPF
jgi:phosphohistidine phosphatase SixA